MALSAVGLAQKIISHFWKEISVGSKISEDLERKNFQYLAINCGNLQGNLIGDHEISVTMKIIFKNVNIF